MGIFDIFKGRKADDSRDVQTLVKQLKDEDPRVRERAAVHLGELGSDGWEAAGVLTDRLGDDDARVRLQAADAVIKVGGDIGRALDALTALLTSDDATLRHDAAIQIGRSGERAEPALPALIEALGDPDDDVCRVTIDTIFKIGEVGVPKLAEAIKAGPDRARINATIAAYKVAPVSIPVFLDLTDDDNPKDEMFIGACGLADLVPAEENLEIILEALESDDWLFRMWAAQALGLLGPEVKTEAEAPLAKASNDARPEVARAAKEAIEKINRPPMGED